MRLIGGERDSRWTNGSHPLLVCTLDPRILAESVGMHRAISIIAFPDQGGAAPHALKAELPEDLHGGSFPHAIGEEGTGIASGIDQLPPTVHDFRINSALDAVVAPCMNGFLRGQSISLHSAFPLTTQGLLPHQT